MTESLMSYNSDTTEEQNRKIQMLRDVFMLAEEAVLARCPDSRRRSLCLSHLETALMFAVKSVAMGK